MVHPKNLIKTYAINELFSVITDTVTTGTTGVDNITDTFLLDNTYIHIHDISPAPYNIKFNTIKCEIKTGIYSDTILIILDMSEFNIWKKLCEECEYITYISNLSDIIKKTEVLNDFIVIKHTRINNKKDMLPNLFINHFKNVIWKRVVLNTNKISKLNQFKSKETYILDTSNNRIYRKTNIYTKYIKCS